MNNGCFLCPISCGAKRTVKVGACRAGDKIKIAKYYLHKFEEPCIAGEKGSGTVFFCGCSLACKFCQNYELSRNLRGKEISVSHLAEIFYSLEKEGAANINLVSPTQYSDKIIDALKIYRPKIPVVYNTHGYEKLDALKKIDEYIDIYLPDLKFCSPALAMRYTGKENYFEYASQAILFMAQKPLVFDKNGMMKSGTIVRHLVLPTCTQDSKRIIDFFAESVGDKAYLNLMSQYTPMGDIKDLPELNRK
nr:radical SAM protein [Clostridia bacterium]